MLIRARVKRNMYFDSITLMRAARTLDKLPGIDEAAALMATAPNLQLLADAGLAPPEMDAGPEDLLLVVRADNEEHARAALDAAEEQLARQQRTPRGGVEQPTQPRSLEQALRLRPGARVAAISVPGPYAALESERALRQGLHVFLFSDNVPLEDEIALKRLAQERGVLLMGPDCGTAMLNGVGLGFVNVVPRGPIGIVGASGTGMQQVMSLIAQQGSGISQAIGCGGRDLSEAVGALTTLQGIRLLQEDEQTKVIVLISKPPAPAVADSVLEAAHATGKPIVAIFVGADHEALRSRYGNRIMITSTLTEAATAALKLLQTAAPTASVAAPAGSPAVSGPRATRGRLAALFSGGTLCDEAMHIWAQRLGPIYSNIPLRPEWQYKEGEALHGHCALDFGADEYTRGRPHPMIDPSLRLKRFRELAAEPDVAVILLDIVLGYCAHPDPAAVHAPVIREALDAAVRAGRELSVVVSLCGTEGDPQRLSVQTAKLREAGAEVFTSNAAAALHCVELLEKGEHDA